MRSSHSLDALGVQFDDANLLADAGLVLTATLAQHLGIEQLYARHVRLGDAPGRPNAGVKAMTLISSAIAGGDCIDDSDVLRSGMTHVVLGHELRAPSTLGTFLRSFCWGDVRSLDKVARTALCRAWAAGAAPVAEELTVDVDSSICETYGLAKEGGSGFTYRRVRATTRCWPWPRTRCCIPGSGAAPPIPDEVPRVSWPRPSPGYGRPATKARSCSGPTPASTTTWWWRPVSARGCASRSPPRCLPPCTRSSMPSWMGPGSRSRTSWRAPR